MRVILTTALVLAVAARGYAQGGLAPGSNLPAWADSALRASPAWSGVDLDSRSPVPGVGDFDGDGLEDVVVPVHNRSTLDHGLAVIHRIDGSVHILGAGTAVGDGTVEIRNWGVVELRHGKSAIRVIHAMGDGGLLVWDGHTYHWVPD